MKKETNEEPWGLIESRRLVHQMKANLFSDGLHDAAQCVLTSLANERSTIRRLQEQGVLSDFAALVEYDRIDQIVAYLK